jgi:hypothetical protein
MHFSDKLSYKILFISSYRLKDMIYTRITLCSDFQKNKQKTGKAESWPDLSPSGEWRRIETIARRRWFGGFLMGRSPVGIGSVKKKRKKVGVYICQI